MATTVSQIINTPIAPALAPTGVAVSGFLSFGLTINGFQAQYPLKVLFGSADADPLFSAYPVIAGSVCTVPSKRFSIPRATAINTAQIVPLTLENGNWVCVLQSGGATTHTYEILTAIDQYFQQG